MKRSFLEINFDNNSELKLLISKKSFADTSERFSKELFKKIAIISENEYGISFKDTYTKLLKVSTNDLIFIENGILLISQKLEKITKGFTLYFWFNEIPIYERKHFLPFLEYINYSKTMDRLLYTTFDYIIYVFYLLIKDEIELEELDHTVVSDQGSFLETQALQDPTRFAAFFRMAKPMWIKDFIHIDCMQRVWMRLHVNR